MGNPGFNPGLGWGKLAIKDIIGTADKIWIWTVGFRWQYCVYVKFLGFNIYILSM